MLWSVWNALLYFKFLNENHINLPLRSKSRSNSKFEANIKFSEKTTAIKIKYCFIVIKLFSLKVS